MIARACVVALLLVACDHGGNAWKPPIDVPDSGVHYGGSWTPYWPVLVHDGEPVETEHFIVFSNFSSADARLDLGTRADVLWPEILELYRVSPDAFTWLPSYDSHKIHLFADYGQMAQSGLAYRDGAIMRAIDHPNYLMFYTPESYRRVLKHEISHVVEFLLIGSSAYQQANSVWLREGAATYSGGAGSPVDTVDKLRTWRTNMANVPGAGNPIAIFTWTDFPQEIRDANRTIEYYPLFQLATRYLVDPLGLGKTMDDLTAMYDDLGDGVAFEDAFQANFGLSVQVYEADFFNRMEAFLAKLEAAP